MSIDELLMTSPFLVTDPNFSWKSPLIDDSDRVDSWTSLFLASGSMIPNGFHDSPFFRFSFFAHFGGWTIPFEFTNGTSPFRNSTIPMQFTYAPRRFSPRIDELLMEVAVYRCGSTIPIEFTHGLPHFSQADR